MRGLSLLLGTAGAVAGFLTWIGLSDLLPADPAAASMSVRLGLAAFSLLPAVAVLAAMVLAQMIARFWQGAFDPGAGKDGQFLRLNQRVISNSVEQIAILAPAILALAAGAPGVQMGQVIALAWVFALARLLFWAGYLISPMLRAPGMAASFAVCLAALGWAVFVWV